MVDSMKPKIKRYAYIVIALVIIALFFPLRENIEISQTSTIYRNNEEAYEEKCEIAIIGVYKRYLFKDNEFIGDIEIRKDGEILQVKSAQLKLNDNMSQLYNKDDSNHINLGKHRFIGDLVTNNKFTKVAFLLAEKNNDNYGWSGDNGMFVTLPSSNRDQSIEIMYELSQKNNWLQNATWK